MSKRTNDRYGIKLASIIEPLETRRLLSTVVVNTTADSTDAKGSSTISLRDAIAVANTATSATTITFSPTVFFAAKTITLGGSAMIISNAKAATTITGPSAGLTISGNKKSQAFVIENGAVATISTLTLTNCAITVPNPITNSPSGGAILVAGSGTLNLLDSTLTGNTAAAYAGAVDGNNGIVNLYNDTITKNSSGTDGGGVSGVGGVTIKDCTITGNSTSGSGGGVYATVTDTIGNSIIAGNTASTSGPDIAVQSNSVKSLGYNLIGNTGSTTGWTSHDQVGTTAKPLSAGLGSLASNGGPTQTFLPLAGSLAIDKGSNALVPSGITTDQRGLSRIFNGTVDIGAVEVQPVLALTAPANQTASAGTSKSVTLGSFTALDATSPYKDTITWGDGSASTTLSLTAAGTIPATAHTFAKTGTITVTELITDAKGNKSNTISFTETVTAALSSITGTVFNDGNGDGKLDDRELGIAGYTVFIDLKGTGVYASGDPTSVTTLSGAFSFSNLAAGTYKIAVEPVSGVTNSTAKELTITIKAGQNSTGNLFGEESAA